MDEHGSRFLLAGEQDAFKEKAGNLFSALDDVQYSPAEEGDSFLKSDPVRDENQKTRMGGTHAGHGRQSTQNAASAPVHRCEGTSSDMPPPRVPALKRKHKNPVPGHIMDPSKYTKYSLEDVPDNQLSQKSNTAAALAFLREIDDRQIQDEGEDTEPEGSRPVFKKPTRKSVSKVVDKETSNTTTAEPGSAGTSQNKAKPKSKKGSAIQLSHLEYEDED